jgi:NADPH:quinone reductase-like Zn-dependent oxidoreductase
VTRRYPHTPGIDAAGVVVDSASGEFQPGDEVIVTSYDLGMNTDGSGRPLLKAVWAGSVDSVGGELLATTLKSTVAYGVVACCAAMRRRRICPSTCIRSSCAVFAWSVSTPGTVP